MRILLLVVLVQDIASGLEREEEDNHRNDCFVWTTGGKLELSKCLHCILFCIFEPNGAPRVESASNAGNDLVAITLGQELISSEIKRRDCSKAQRTLGAWTTDDGCDNGLFCAINATDADLPLSASMLS